MRFASLGSGSKGNATLVQWNNGCLLIDCGFSVREIDRRLDRLDLDAESISAILVTHEHGDHIRGVVPMARRYNLPVYMTPGTASSQRNLPKDLQLIDARQRFAIDGIEITPVAVPHDAREPVQFIIDDRNVRFGVLTDVGWIAPHVKRQYADCDGLLLEANHDTELLAQGSYPASLKRRVGGDRGHLSNRQAADFLRDLNGSRLKQLVVGHISQQNNAVDLVDRELSVLQEFDGDIVYASQDHGTDWQILNC